MRKYLAAVAALAALSACATVNPDGTPVTPQQEAATAIDIACGVYLSDRATLDQEVAAGRLSLDTTGTLYQVMQAADAACSGPAPVDLKSAIIAINGAAVKVGLAIAEAKQKQAVTPAAGS